MESRGPAQPASLEQWLAHFRSEGHERSELLAAGMEGAVYRLRPGLLAKVWTARPRDQLVLLRRFYRSLRAQNMPFATPAILRIDQAQGRCVTYEAELPGRPLKDHLPSVAADPPGPAIACIEEVLGVLASTPPLSAALVLPVLGESAPFRDRGWRESLFALLERRTADFGDLLRASVPGFDRTYDCLCAALRALPSAGESVLHGDLCPENILVDESLAPLAVLDWGFLTTAGDPIFDAAVAAGIFDMYGPHAAATERRLSRRIEDRLAYPRGALLAYLAAYAVATANAYDRAGRDGHFAWCAATLRRPDVVAAISSQT